MLATSREVGYRHLEVALRLRGEALTAIDPAAARSDLDTAQRILEEIGARHDVGKALVARAMLHRAAGEEAEALSLLHRALAVFEPRSSSRRTFRFVSGSRMLLSESAEVMAKDSQNDALCFSFSYSL